MVSSLKKCHEFIQCKCLFQTNALVGIPDVSCCAAKSMMVRRNTHAVKYGDEPISFMG